MPRYLLAILLSWSILLGAQNPQLGTIHFNVNNGLPSSEVHDLLQDQKGYLWIATDNGASRFNGYSFRNFGPENGLLGNAVFSLFGDQEDNIWMSTFKGLYFYDPVLDTIQAFSYNHLIDEYKATSNSDLVESFFIDDQGTVYNSISKFGVVAIYCDGTHRLLKEVQKNVYFVFQQDRHALISPLYSSAGRNSLVDSLPLLLYQQKGIELSTTQFYRNQQISFSGYQSTLALAADRLLLSSGKHLYLVDKNEVRFIAELPEMILTQEQTKNAGIYLGLSKGQQEGGVNYYPSENALYENRSLHYLNDYSVTDVIEDRKGGLWFSTKEDGIFYCSNPAVKIYDQRFGLASDYITALVPKNEHELFIGLNNGYTYHLDVRNNKLTNLRPNTTEIYDLAYDQSTGWLWRGSTQGLQYYREGQWWDAEKTEEDNSLGHKKFDVYPGGKIHGSSPGPYGFATYDAKTGQLLFHVYEKQHLKKRTFCIYQDFGGRQWVGLTDGLYELRNDSLLRPAQMHPSFRIRVEEIAQLADSTFVVGTKGKGLVLWRGTEIIQLDQSHGLTADMIEKIHIDAAQHIWVGTLNGLNRIKRSGDQFLIQTYTISDGLPSNEITDISSRGDYIWVATTKGIAQLPARESGQSFAMQTPIIDKVVVNNQRWVKTDSKHWPHWKSNVQFNFFAIDY